MSDKDLQGQQNRHKYICSKDLQRIIFVNDLQQSPKNKFD